MIEHIGTSWDGKLARASFRHTDDTKRGDYRYAFTIEQYCFDGEDRACFDRLVEKIETTLNESTSYA